MIPETGAKDNGADEAKGDLCRLGFGSAWGLESGKNNGYPYLLWEYEVDLVKGVSLTPSVLTLKPVTGR